MKSAKEEIERLEKVTPDIFAAFLNEKKGSQFCLSCGSPRLVIPEVDNQTFIASMDGTSSSTVNKYVTYYKISELRPVSPDNCEYRVICSNCG